MEPKKAVVENDIDDDEELSKMLEEADEEIAQEDDKPKVGTFRNIFFPLIT